MSLINKIDLIQKLKDSAGLSKPEAASVTDVFFNSMTNALAKDEQVGMRGLCSFFVKEYKSYTGQNPRTV